KALITTVAASIVITYGLVAHNVVRPSVVAQETITGDWTAKIRETGRGSMLWLSLSRKEAVGKGFQMSTDIPLGDFTGLNPNSGTDAQFSLKRDAGAVVFTGLFRNGNGVGEFRFTPNGGFVSTMQNLGYDGLTTEKLFTMAIHDVGTGFINELKSLGYEKVPLNKLIAM